MSHSALSQDCACSWTSPRTPSWESSLRAERKIPATIKVYMDGVRRFLSLRDVTGRAPELTRRAVT